MIRYHAAIFYIVSKLRAGVLSYEADVSNLVISDTPPCPDFSLLYKDPPMKKSRRTN